MHSFTRRPSLATLGTLAVLTAVSLPAVVRAQARGATAATVLAARQDLASGILAVSRNPSAFVQEARATPGCDVTITSVRMEKADSLFESQTFPMGQLTTASRMSMASSGGIILFTFATPKGAPVVTRVRTLGAAPKPTTGNGASGGAGERVAEVVVMIAETSQQADVLAFTNAWTALVRACGGEVAN